MGISYCGAGDEDDDDDDDEDEDVDDDEDDVDDDVEDEDAIRKQTMIGIEVAQIAHTRSIYSTNTNPWNTV